MTRAAHILLAGIIAAMLCVIAIWQTFAQFALDATGFAAVLAILPAPALIYFFYTYRRPDSRVSAMAGGLCFLVTLGPCCTILTYFCLSLGLSRIDAELAAFDRMLGFDWPGLATYSAQHPTFNFILATVYRLSVWQVIALLVFLGWKSPTPSDIDKLCFAIAVCGIGTILIWAAFPSIGATTVYVLPDIIDAKRHAAVDNAYTRELLRLYSHGPHTIMPANVRGLVGFPSFHAGEAVVVTWFARKIRPVFLIALAFNALTLLSCPIQGGHHLADVIGGVAVAIAAIAASERMVDYLERGRARPVGQAILESA